METTDSLVQELAELKKLLTFYENVLNQINEGVHVVDDHGTTRLYNRKMTELEWMEEKDVLGKKLLDVFQFPSGQESTLLQALQNGTLTRGVRQTYYNDKGKKITTINNTFPIWSDQRIVGAVEIANDVTKMERLLRESILEQEKSRTRYTFDSIIGQSEAIQEVMENAKRAARTTSSVLVVGETGTGKELFVQSIHNASHRANGPFISQNCAALPESLIEGLLFGTSRGAFTGAIERPGLFEQAEGGTLFLDEIHALSLPLQAKLLRALQEKSIRRIGDTKDRAINARIIAAMNEDPIEAISQNRIRKDLYYRLGVVTLFVPPLRERRADIPLLVDHFMQRYNALFQMEVRGVSEEVQRFFAQYEWPGNVRELQHMIEGAMNLMAEETEIQTAHLPLQRAHRQSLVMPEQEQVQEVPVTSVSAERDLLFEATTNMEAGSVQNLKQKLQEFEQHYIRQALAAYKGNVTRAAKALGISRQSLQYRLRKSPKPQK